MIPLSFIFLGILGTTLVPAYIGLYLVSNLRFVRTRYVAAAGVGLAFWFFYDTMGDAASLEENNSVYPPYLFGGLPHFALIGAFVAGVAALAIFDHFAVSAPRSQGGTSDASRANPRLLFLIPVALAAVMGIHGLGEGWDAASAVAGAPFNGASILDSLIQAFGTVPAVVSYPIHKFLEASIIGAAYTCYVSMSGGVVKTKWWDIPLLGILFGGPSVVGATLGYYVPVDTTYFFAFGVTSALYAALRLVEPTRAGFKVGVDAPSYLGWKVFLAMAVGFFLLYGAALLH
jgi:hypothetical protein